VQKLKNLLTHRTFLLFLVLTVLTGFLAVTTFFRPQLLIGSFNRLKDLGGDIYQGRVFAEKSSARVFTESTKVNIQFKIVKNDKSALSQFNQKLGVGEEYLKGIVLDLDDVTIKKLEDYLPLDLTLEVTPDRVNFKSGIVPGFVSSLVTETKEFSTGSGKLKMSQFSSSEFKLEITEPEPLLKYATESGQFVLSDKLLPLFSILARVGTIELLVNGQSVSGGINVK
jgi:hypothetical protein